ncbi:hypothetical protein Tco_1575089 [Tanacetum coccineum]
MGCSVAVHCELQAYRAHTQIKGLRISSQEALTATLVAQVSSLQSQLIAALGQIQVLQARDPAHVDDPEDVDTSTMKMASRRGTKTRTTLATATATTTTTTPMTDTTIRELIAQGMANALVGRLIQRNTNLNDDGSQYSGSGITRPVHPTRECTYSDFLKCQPLNFKGTEGVVGLTQWFERIKSVFDISNCAVKNQVKFATCILHGIALTWWNTHVKTFGHDTAYGMPWKTLMKMMTTKYCPQNEFMKLEIETWNLKVKGWNGYLRKRRKTKPKRQNRTRNGKDCERQSQIEAEKSIKSKSQQKSQLVKVKVNPDKSKSQHVKKYKFEG